MSFGHSRILKKDVFVKRLLISLASLRWTHKIVYVLCKFVLIFLVFFSPLKAQAKLFFQFPYVQNVSQTKATIIWNTHFSSRGKLSYGPTKKMRYQATTHKKNLQHVVRLNNLEPNTQYFYKVSYYNFWPGERLSFKTAPTQDGTDFSFAVMGDSGRLTTGQLRLASQINRNKFDFLLHLGDVVYGSGEETAYNLKFFFPYEATLKRTPFFPTLGNHDVKTNLGAPYFKVFDLPTNNPQQTERYYSFEWGDALFICLDSIISPLTEGSIQYEWLERKLSRSDHLWKFVYFHVPIFTSSPKGPHKAFWNLLAPLFEKQEVDMVFSGHHHIYERSFPIRRFEDDGPGVIYITSGGGGAHLKAKNIKLLPGSAIAKVKYHFLKIDIRKKQLWLKAIDDNNQVIDKYYLSK